VHQQISQSRQGELALKRYERLEAERVSLQIAQLGGRYIYCYICGPNSADVASSSPKQSG